MLYSFLLLLCIWSLPAHALILEEMLANDTLHTTLENKKVGYSASSFDPLHKAHEAIVETALTQNFCDFIILHPVWGGDKYKVRSSVAIRLDMLFSVYKDHPKVLVSRFSPKQLQDALLPLFDKTTFIGVIGSDTALYLAPNPETSIVYMTGLKIAKEYSEHTWGSCMAVPASSFIVALREGDNISPLNGMLRERPIIATFSIGDVASLSSTALKKALNNGESIDSQVSAPIQAIIEKHKLYR